MQLRTTRFGSVAIDAEDVLQFPVGVIGFETCRRWVLLGDAQNESVGWLQSVDRPELALPVVSPRRFAPQYRIRVGARQLEGLRLDDSHRVYALLVLSEDQGAMTVNLRAPILINLNRRLGRQVITTDEQPLQMAIPHASSQLRKSA